MENNKNIIYDKLSYSCINEKNNSIGDQQNWINYLNNNNPIGGNEKKNFEVTTDFLTAFENFQKEINIDELQYSKFKNTIIELLNKNGLNNNSEEANFLKNITKEEVIIIISILIISALIIYFGGQIATILGIIGRGLSPIGINLITKALQYEKTSSFLIAFIPGSGKSGLINLAPNQTYFQTGYFSKELIQMLGPKFYSLIELVKGSLS